MSKTKPIIIGRVGDNYTIRYLGGSMPATPQDIRGKLANIWGRYIDTHPDLSIVGATEGLEDYIEELASGRASDVVRFRVTPVEKASIEAAAKATGHSTVSAYLLALHRVHGPK